MIPEKRQNIKRPHQNQLVSHNHRSSSKHLVPLYHDELHDFGVRTGCPARNIVDINLGK